jgi:tetratricopeptide (TPR) repeat protein
MMTSQPPTDRNSFPILERLRSALAGKYDVEREIGRGGMAAIYLARDVRHPRNVAIKVLPPELATAIAAERFVLEIKTSAQLLHPHILGLIDSGEADGLLYYIMPHVRGESLRARIAREGRLAPDEAARIGCEVASALEHAHGMGIVHRDIKPDNILLADGSHVLVADFGLARAILQATDQRLTSSRRILGTPLYMSPEQAFGLQQLDGRADIYSLGCVLLDMLTGLPSFDSKRDAAKPEGAVSLAQTDFLTPRQRAQRADMPRSLKLIVERALQEDPARRFPSAGAMREALDHARLGTSAAWISGLSGWVREHPQLSRRGMGALAAVVTLAIVLVSSPAEPVRERIATLWAPALDSSRYAILPFRREQEAPMELSPELMLHDALARWRGVSVVEQFQVQDAVRRLGGARISARDAPRITRRLGAGRYVWGEVASAGDSLRVHATLFDARDGTELGSATVKVSRASLVREVPFEWVADALLFRGAPVTGREESNAGTESYAARSAYLRGRLALLDWNLAAADSAFSRAITADGNFSAAHLWLGQVRGWMSDDPIQWHAIASKAVAGRERLSAREQKLAQALLHLAGGEFPQACALYEELKRADPRDFTATYGLGECIRRDFVVVRDPGSPSGWRFRGSRHRAVNAYREAFQLLPTIHQAFRARAFERMRGMLFTETSLRITGRRLPPDTMEFRAAPAWAGDTLVLIPYPTQLEVTHPERTVSPTTVDAVDHQRRIFRDIAATWRQALPDAVEPLEAMAVALELLGDSTALDTLGRLRRMAVTDDRRLRLAAQEVWLRVKLGMPDDSRGLTLARRLADSLLAEAGNARGPSAELLAGLAMLTGRVGLAASLAQRTAQPLSGPIAVPMGIVATSRALLVYAALGGPVDSLRALESRITTQLAGRVAPSQRAAALSPLLGQAAGLAFPVYRFRSIEQLAGHGNPVLDAQAALARGDPDQARMILKDTKRRRAARRPADLTLDITYPAAWTLMAIGDPDDALEWLDPVLNAAPLFPPRSLSSIASSGALMRALLLRSRLARLGGDEAGARRWSEPVVVLWQHADPFLRSIVEEHRAGVGLPPRAVGSPRGP